MKTSIGMKSVRAGVVVAVAFVAFAAPGPLRGQAALDAREKSQTYTNEPITPGYLYNSDPTCRQIGDTFYLFCSHDQSTRNFTKGNYATMYDYHCYTTKNFKDWVDHGSIINALDVDWGSTRFGPLWDGDAGIPANGKYYAYLPYDRGAWWVGVFVADKPEGPYRDALGKPLITSRTPNVAKCRLGVVSPSVVFDEKGTAYLYFGQGDLFVARLNPDMISLAEDPVRTTIPVDYFEGPIIARINGKYYMSYANGYGGKGYVEYCVADTPYGPWTNQRHLMLPWPKQHSAHHGMTRYNGQWYLAYHKDFYQRGFEYHRQTFITPMTVNADGSLGVIDPANDPGVPGSSPKTLRLDAFAVRREAEEFHERKGGDEEKGVWEDYHFKMKDGGYLRFNGMDFGAGAAGVKAEVSCENAGIVKGRLEFRLDAVDGKLIGECAVGSTGGILSYVDLTAPVSGASGVHDLFIVARGSGGNTNGQLFNLNWFTFTHSYEAPVAPVLGVNCGGEAVDGLAADQAYAPGGWGYAGQTLVRVNGETNYPTLDCARALKTERCAAADRGTFSYRFTLPAAQYRMQLCFAENYVTAEGAARFNVSINGQAKLRDFDVFLAASGRHRGVAREFDAVTPSTNGTVEVKFASLVERAKVSAIRIFPQRDAAATKGSVR